MVLFNKYWGLILVLLLSFFSVSPFFNSGFFPMHDDTQVARVYEMGKALKDGMFPVRWVSDLGYGYGYPVFNFYAPLAYYVGGIFNFFGFDALLSTKMMMILGIFLAGVFMYLLAREFWGEIGGLISALFYIYAPYHAIDIYVRGDVGEFYSYVFIPLAFLGFYKVFYSLNNQKSNIKNIKNQISKTEIKDQKTWKWVTIGSIGYAGVILSHNLTAMMVTPFLLILIAMSFYIGIKKKQFSTFNFQLSILILGVLLSAFYWLPALTEMNYTNVLSQIGMGADFKDHFVCLQQLWNSPWGFGGSTKGCIDGMSFKLGKLHILLSVISLVLLVIMMFKNKLFIHSHRIVSILLSLVGLLMSLFLMLEISKPMWETIPFMAFFQYPWRFLLMTSFFTSFLAGSVIWFLAKRCYKVIYIISIFTIVILIFLNGKLFNPQKIISKTAADYTSDYALKWVASKISDEYLPKDFVKPKSFSEIPKNKTYLRNYQKETFIQKLANFLSLAGISILILGIIYIHKRRIYQ